ncbi:hypothetical protein [uncultured Neglectibacter sp.]|uniref:hypothetical protein n=1 Tax=uncultured Neglectibacter sp. TaxID=1924108 RepID=UPI0034DF4E91
MERKAGENTKKYSIFDFGSPCGARVSGGRNGQLTQAFRVRPVMTTSIRFHIFLITPTQHFAKAETAAFAGDFPAFYNDAILARRAGKVKYYSPKG